MSTPQRRPAPAVTGRRTLLAALASLPAFAARHAGATVPDGDALARGCAAIEASLGGRLGVAVLDPASGRRAAYRGEERFPLCSTHKVLAAGCLLFRADRGQDSLDRRIAFTQAALVPYSPLTAPAAGTDGLTLGALCEAAVTLSDNTAANLLLEAIGGPAALTAWLRAQGDGATRLDRTEPTLNEARPGDPRDTTTPAAMAGTLGRLVLGDALTPASRALLADWMVACRTGGRRLRAGLPAGWRAGDKTGSGDFATANDVAVIWPPERPPLVVAAYLTQSAAPPAARDAALAAVGRSIAAW
jgi:beta-lactamase class A